MCHDGKREWILTVWLVLVFSVCVMMMRFLLYTTFCFSSVEKVFSFGGMEVFINYFLYIDASVTWGRWWNIGYFTNFLNHANDQTLDILQISWTMQMIRHWIFYKFPEPCKWSDIGYFTNFLNHANDQTLDILQISWAIAFHACMLVQNVENVRVADLIFWPFVYLDEVGRCCSIEYIIHKSKDKKGGVCYNAWTLKHIIFSCWDFSNLLRYLNTQACILLSLVLFMASGINCFHLDIDYRSTKMRKLVFAKLYVISARTRKWVVAAIFMLGRLTKFI